MKYTITIVFLAALAFGTPAFGQNEDDTAHFCPEVGKLAVAVAKSRDNGMPLAEPRKSKPRPEETRTG